MNPNDTTSDAIKSATQKLADITEFLRDTFALPSVEQAVIEVEAKLVADQLQEWLDRCEEER